MESNESSAVVQTSSPSDTPPLPSVRSPQSSSNVPDARPARYPTRVCRPVDSYFFLTCVFSLRREGCTVLLELCKVTIIILY